MSDEFQIDDLQQKLLTLGDKLIERNGTVENICKKYLNLKKRKDEQKILLCGSIETLQVETIRAREICSRTKSIGRSRSPRNSLSPTVDRSACQTGNRTMFREGKDSRIRQVYCYFGKRAIRGRGNDLERPIDSCVTVYPNRIVTDRF